MYAWLAGAAIGLVAFVFLMRQRKSAGQTQAQKLTPGQPYVSPGQGAPPVPYPDGTGPSYPPPKPIQPLPPFPVQPGGAAAPPAGSVPGSDFGWFHGPVGTNPPPGFESEWRWTDWFISAHRQDMPWLSDEPALFTGYQFFQNVPGLGPAPPYSWEWKYAPVQTPSSQIAPALAQTISG